MAIVTSAQLTMALGGFQCLPERPHAVHHTMVNPESRVSGRGEKITARVATDGVVNATMRANLGSVGNTLGEEAIRRDVRFQEKAQNGRVVGVARVHGTAKVPFQAAGVPSQAAVWARLSTVQAPDRSKVDSHVGKGTGGDETSTGAGGKGNRVAINALGRDNGRTLVRYIITITSQAVRITIEKRGVLWSMGVLGPVPVLPRERRKKVVSCGLIGA